MYQPATSDTANHASTRCQARADVGGGGEKETSYHCIASAYNLFI